MLAAAIATAGVPLAQPSTPTVVRTDLGAVRGLAAAGVISFKGIPYAAPPMGDLRCDGLVPVPAVDALAEPQGPLPETGRDLPRPRVRRTAMAAWLRRADLGATSASRSWASVALSTAKDWGLV
jgi:hypothetical protein